VTYDVIVVGLGAMGSAAAWQLARRGRRVLGLDALSPGHTLGSSHGHTRIIRKAYFEDPAYVPLLERAYAMWDGLSTLAGEPLVRRTGGLMLGPESADVVNGAVRSAREHGLPILGLCLVREGSGFRSNCERVLATIRPSSDSTPSTLTRCSSASRRRSICATSASMATCRTT